MIYKKNKNKLIFDDIELLWWSFFSEAVLKYSLLKKKLNFEDFPGATYLSKLLKPGSLSYRSNKCFRLVVNILKLKILFFSDGPRTSLYNKKNKADMKILLSAHFYTQPSWILFTRPQINRKLMATYKKPTHIHYVRSEGSSFSAFAQGSRCKMQEVCRDRNRISCLQFVIPARLLKWTKQTLAPKKACSKLI